MAVLRGGLPGIARAVLPKRYRALLRRNWLLQKYLKLRYSGCQSIQHPNSPFTLYFDGVRNLGWLTGSFIEDERADMRFAARQLDERKTACAWDVGANIGSWTLFLAGRSPAIGQIVSFEPDEINRRYLEMNIARNGIGNVRVMAAGLSSRSGSASFFPDLATGATGTLNEEPPWEFQARPQPVTVPVMAMDELIASGMTPPDFIKIDVEGHELNVLEGGAATLAKHRPLMIIEVTANADRVGEILAELGYTMVDPASGKKLDKAQFATAAIPSS